MSGKNDAECVRTQSRSAGRKPVRGVPSSVIASSAYSVMIRSISSGRVRSGGMVIGTARYSSHSSAAWAQNHEPDLRVLSAQRGDDAGEVVRKPQVPHAQ